MSGKFSEGIDKYHPPVETGVSHLGMDSDGLFENNGLLEDIYAFGGGSKRGTGKNCLVMSFMIVTAQQIMSLCHYYQVKMGESSATYVQDDNSYRNSVVKPKGKSTLARL